MAEFKPKLRLSNKQKKNETAIIYALRDPITDEIRYIGKTFRSVEFRLYEHTREALKRQRWPVSLWIRQLHTAGLAPTIEIIETIAAGGDWAAAEIKWIAYARGESVVGILNATDGGDGASGRVHSDKARAEMSRIAIQQGRKPPGNLGRIFGPEARANMSAAHKGLPANSMSVEHRAKLTASRTGLKWTDAQRLMLSEAHKGYITPQSQRDNLSKAMRLVWEKRKRGELPLPIWQTSRSRSST